MARVLLRPSLRERTTDSMTSRFAVGSQELTAILTTNVIAI